MRTQSDSQSERQSSNDSRQRGGYTWTVARQICILLLVTSCLFAVSGVIFDGVGTVSATSVDVGESGNVSINPTDVDMNG